MAQIRSSLQENPPFTKSLAYKLVLLVVELKDGFLEVTDATMNQLR